MGDMVTRGWLAMVVVGETHCGVVGVLSTNHGVAYFFSIFLFFFSFWLPILCIVLMSSLEILFIHVDCCLLFCGLGDPGL